MSKQAIVGLFTLLGLFAVFVVFYVIGDIGVRNSGYKIGAHFTGASGLRPAAGVFLSGVPIGAVDQIELLPDYTTEVVMAIKATYSIPVGSKFLIQAPLTGEPTILIEPPKNIDGRARTLAREIVPISQQPRGVNPASIADLLEQGQGEVRRLDAILGQLQTAEPQLLAELKSTLANANDLTTNANRSIATLTTKVTDLTDSLQKNLTVASSNVVDLTGALDTVVKRDSGQVDVLLANLTRTSRSFGETVDSLHDVATNPKVKNNLVNTTRDFAATAKTFAELTNDLRQVTGNPQTQAQLRDTVAQLDATTQKVDSLVGSLGGTSSVYGVDPGATPAPAVATPDPGSVPTSKPLFGKPGSSQSDASSAAAGTTASTGPPASTSNGRRANAATNAKLGSLKEKLKSFTKDLFELQVRVSQLSPQPGGSAGANASPLLTSDRGPQSDFNLFVLPRGATGFQFGANDIGSRGTASANVLLLNRTRGFTYGGGVLYSRLGVTASVARGALGLEARAYDLRHPTLDSYVTYGATPKLQVFGGERDITHASRRSVLGLQFEL
ncbi:MAG: hypothetical protein NVS3B17_02940 [Vulcanimicrobiaceae bacterium]